MAPLLGFVRRPAAYSSQTSPQCSPWGSHGRHWPTQLERGKRCGVEVQNPRGTRHAKRSITSRYFRGRGLCLVAAGCGRQVLPAGTDLGLSRQLPVHDLRAMLALRVRDRCILRYKSALCLCARGISLSPALPELLSESLISRAPVRKPDRVPFPCGGRMIAALTARAGFRQCAKRDSTRSASQNSPKFAFQISSGTSRLGSHRSRRCVGDPRRAST